MATESWLRLVAATESRKDAASKADEAKGARQEAKKTLDDRTETMDAAAEENAKEYPDGSLPAERNKSFTKIVRDRRRAQNAFDLADRRSRQLNHQADELQAELNRICEEITGADEALNFSAGQAAGPDAWKRVPLSALMGEVYALPYVKVGMNSVGEAVESAGAKKIGGIVSAGEITQSQADFLIVKLRHFLNQRGIKGHNLPGVKDEDVLPEGPKIVPAKGGEAKAEEKGDEIPERCTFSQAQEILGITRQGIAAAIEAGDLEEAREGSFRFVHGEQVRKYKAKLAKEQAKHAGGTVNGTRSNGKSLQLAK